MKRKAENKENIAPKKGKIKIINETAKTNVYECLSLDSTHDIICRNDQINKIKDIISTSLRNNQNNFIYVCGRPGTGKTFTIQSVTKYFDKIFTSFYINRNNVSDSDQLVNTFFNQFHDNNSKIKSDIKSSKINKTKILLILDEFDGLSKCSDKIFKPLLNKLISSKYLFNIITISNHSDVESRVTNYFKNQVNMHIIVYKTYEAVEIYQIIKNRLKYLPDDVFTENAIDFCCKKVANVDGDIRKAFNLLKMSYENMIRSQPTNLLVDINIVQNTFENINQSSSKTLSTNQFNLSLNQWMSIVAVLISSKSLMKSMFLANIHQEYKKINLQQNLQPLDINDFLCVIQSLESLGILILTRTKIKQPFKIELNVSEEEAILQLKKVQDIYNKYADILKPLF